MVQIGTTALVAALATLPAASAAAAFAGPSPFAPFPAVASVSALSASPLPPALSDPFARLAAKIAQTERSAEALERSTVSSGARGTLSVLDRADSLLHEIAAGPAEAARAATGAAARTAEGAATALDSAVRSSAALDGPYEALRATLDQAAPAFGAEVAGLSPGVLLVATAALTYGLATAVLGFGTPPPPRRPYPLNKYDAATARAYFDQRLGDVLGRTIEVSAKSAGFGLKLLSDYLSKNLKENSDERALELAKILTELGPSFIKIGQSLSIRTDLLSPAYVRGLKSLQDQVPPFSSSEARDIIEEELGVPLGEVFSEFPEEPVAAASLGQVYRARLRADGREVAIKVQRPDIMNQIAIDMHLIREIAPVLKRTFNLNTDLEGTVDAWGSGFVDELDYIAEARSAEDFTESIASTPLSGVVYAPPVVEECTTGKVLTTEWVVGERLDKSSKDDVTVLCSIAMNTYLTMMLETGTLHCDPHPGNLLRTTDGRLCILDWGMVTKLDSDLQVTLIEHMAHLVSADYEEVPRDLLLLGFIPEEKAHLIKDSGIVEVLADVYGAWTGGGGAAAINVNQVIAQLQDLTEKKGNLFQIPPYFAYIAKSFSVLEGIGLSNDAQYSIINECLPYVSKRLLTDQSERTGGALSTFIFGPEKNNPETRIIDYDRVEQLITGFSDYSTSASGANLGEDKPRTVLVEELADQILLLLASEEETPLQAIFVEQLAKIISSASRSVWTDIREQSGRLPTGRTILGSVVDPLGLFRTSPVVRVNDLDEKTLESTRNLISLFQEQARVSNNPAFDASSLTNEETRQLAGMLVRKVWERRSGIMATSNRLAMKMLQLTADKLESGEREVMMLPTAKALAEDGDHDAPTSTERRQRGTSDRLQSARQILAAAEAGEAVPVGDIPTPKRKDGVVMEPYPLQ